ncbi:hypothetical protein Sango_2484000 [Sesamum angolense]|uniref:Integrase catalytic domain-containing protein n=1 Tax=Sesamum angolense TaxID=2727404 RepID=A0AAE2BI05_9LAMI|nr:hypothetical protein Sango_2484000 [Sesamum angolense]
MNGLEKSINELINILVQYEAMTYKSALTVLVGEASISKAKGKRVKCWKRKKGKGKVVTAPAAPTGKGKGNVGGTQRSKVLERSRRLSKDEIILRLCDGKTGSKIKALQSKRDGEYLSGEFIDLLKENGILSQWTTPGTSQLNGMAERKNRTLLDMVRTMRNFTKLPSSFWGYALETAAKLLNMAEQVA